MKEDKYISQFDEWLKSQLNNAEMPSPEGLWENIQDKVQEAAQNAANTASTTTHLTNTWTQLSGIVKIAIVGTAIGVASFITYTLVAPDTQVTVPESPVENPAIIDDKEDTNEVSSESNISGVADLSSENITLSTTDSHTELNENTTGESTTEFQNTGKDVQTTITDKNKNLNKETIDKSQPVIEKENPETLNLTDTTLCKGDKIDLEALFGITSPKLISIVSNKGSDNIFDKYGRIESGNQLLTIKAIDENQSLVRMRNIRITGDEIPEIKQLNKTEDFLTLSVSAESIAESYWLVNGHLVESGNVLNYYFNQGESAENIEVKMMFKSGSGCWDSTIWNGNSALNLKRDFFIPNVITPNGDGENDVLEIIISGEEQFNIVIFDRQNSIIFQTYDKNIHWNGTDKKGKPLPAGTYFYKFECKFSNQEVQIRHGLIELIRTN